MSLGSMVGRLLLRLVKRVRRFSLPAFYRARIYQDGADTSVRMCASRSAPFQSMLSACFSRDEGRWPH